MSPTHNPVSLPLPLKASAQIEAYWSRALSSYDLHPHGFNTTSAALGRRLKRSVKLGAPDFFSRANKLKHSTLYDSCVNTMAHREPHF